MLPEMTSCEQCNESLRCASGTQSAYVTNANVREKVNLLWTLGMTLQTFRCVLLLEPYGPYRGQHRRSSFFRAGPVHFRAIQCGINKRHWRMLKVIGTVAGWMWYLEVQIVRVIGETLGNVKRERMLIKVHEQSGLSVWEPWNTHIIVYVMHTSSGRRKL